MEVFAESFQKHGEDKIQYIIQNFKNLITLKHKKINKQQMNSVNTHNSISKPDNHRIHFNTMTLQKDIQYIFKKGFEWFIQSIHSYSMHKTYSSKPAEVQTTSYTQKQQIYNISKFRMDP